jgi:hypothetical protein
MPSARIATTIRTATSQTIERNRNARAVVTKPRLRPIRWQPVSDQQHGCEACNHTGDAENALRFVTDGHGVRLLCRDCQQRQHAPTPSDQ